MICKDKKLIKTELPPRDVEHERRDTYVIFPESNHYSVVARTMEPTPRLPQYSERAIWEDKVLTDFNQDSRGETTLGEVRVPKEDTIAHTIGFKLNKFVLTESVPGENFQQCSWKNIFSIG